MERTQGGPAFGIARGHGRGGGWRHRRWFHETGLTGWQRDQTGSSGPGEGMPETLSTRQELTVLRHQVQKLEQLLVEVESRLHEQEKAAPVANAKERE